MSKIKDKESAIIMGLTKEKDIGGKGWETGLTFWRRDQLIQLEKK